MDNINNKEMAVALDTEMLTGKVGVGVNRQVAGRILCYLNLCFTIDFVLS